MLDPGVMRQGLIAALLVIGCGPVVDAAADIDADDSSTTAASPTPNDDGDDGEGIAEPDDDSGDATGSTTHVADDTSSTGDDPSVGCQFLCAPDGGGTTPHCDVWAQDCPDGEKCMPWANDGGGGWNALRCAPLDDSPAAVGDACVVEGSGVSGIDDCGISAMCWGVDGETNTGTCVAFCGGTEADPTCDDPATSCAITNEGVLNLCLPVCDPLLQDCAEGTGCYPVEERFFCVPDAGEKDGAFGSQCDYINVCDPGLFCATAETVPECYGNGCCSTYCDFTEADASGMCPGASGGQECIPWYEAGQAPPGLETLGVCAIPA
jgi:hypothetical protein